MKNDTGTAGDGFYRVWGKFWVGVVAKRSGAKLSKAKRSGVLERDFTGVGEFRGGILAERIEAEGIERNGVERKEKKRREAEQSGGGWCR